MRLLHQHIAVGELLVSLAVCLSWCLPCLCQSPHHSISTSTTGDDDLGHDDPGKIRGFEFEGKPQRFLEVPSFDRQLRRSSFRADLGKRDEFDLDVAKRASRISGFRSDLGKRKWNSEDRKWTSEDRKLRNDDNEESESGEEGVPALRRGPTRSKRLAGYFGESLDGLDDWRKVDLEKRLRSFRSDLGKKSVTEDFVYDEEQFPKRGRYAFRGDLGKRSLGIVQGQGLEKQEDEKRRYSFRGDLGRKRMADSKVVYDGEEDLHGQTDPSVTYFENQRDSDRLEKRRFRADLG